MTLPPCPPLTCIGSDDCMDDTRVRICRLTSRICTYEGAYLNDCPRAHDTGADRLHDLRVERELERAS